MKTITKFLFALVCLLAGASNVQAESICAFELSHAFRPDISSYYFYFSIKNADMVASGAIVFYDSETNEVIGRRELTPEELEGEYAYYGYPARKITTIISTQALTELIEYKSNKNLKWAVELKTTEDDVCTTVASDESLAELPIHGAVVFTPTEGDNKWSNPNNWNLKRVPTLKDAPAVINGTVTIDEDSEASGIVVKNESKILITAKGGLTVGEYGFTDAIYRVRVAHDQVTYDFTGTTIEIENTSAVGKDPNEGAGYLRIDPKATNLPTGVVVKYNTASNPGNYTSTGSNKDRMWQYVGAPGNNTRLYLDYRTWLYEWEGKVWSKMDSNYPNMTSFAGYAITHVGAPSYTMATEIIYGDADIHLPDDYNCDNIFANSYLAPINVAAFDEDDFTGNVEKTFYLFNTGSFNDWYAAASQPYTTEQSPGQYTAIPVLGGSDYMDPEDLLIAPMEGVYVRSFNVNTSAQHNSIKLNYSKHVWKPKTGNVAMHAPQKSNLLSRIRIQAFGEKSGSDRMYIIEDKRCTSGYDNGYDAKNIIADGQVSIYTNEACGTMEVSSTNDMNGMYIGFQASVDTVYTLRFSSLIGENLYIKDLANGNMIELVDDATYTFTAKAHSINNMRFQVLVDPFMTGEDTDGNTTDVDNVLSSNTFWMSDSHICVSTNQANSVATIYNVSGQMIMNVPFNNQVEIPTHNFSTGVYILQTNNERYKFIID